MRWAPWVLLIALAGCSVEPLDLEGRSCPCVEGWTCDDATSTCVRSDGGVPDARADALSPDGSADAAAADGAPDGAPADGSAVDGEADTSVPDAGPSPSGCADVHADRLFCDGFEAADFAAWDSERVPGGSMVERATDIVYRGEASLRATALGTERYAYLDAQVFPVPAPANQYLRAYYYIPSSQPPGIEFSEMTDEGRTYNFIVYTRGGDDADFHTHGWSGGRAPLGMALPTDEWFCLEAHIELGAAGSISIYIDDTLVVTQPDLDNSPPLGLPMIVAGIAWNDSGADRVLYVDEVVADTARIGCD